jgi:hypothetical protein
MAEANNTELTLDVKVEDEDAIHADGSVVVDEKTGDIIAVEPEKQKPDAESHDEDDDDEVTVDADAPEGETEEQRRDRRRQEKRDRRDRQRLARESKDRELRELRRANAEANERLAALERRTVAGEMARLDGAIENAESYVQIARRSMTEALGAQDPAAFDKAQTEWYKAQRQADDLKAHKERFQNAQTQDSRRETQQRLDPETQRHARSWSQKNTWYQQPGNEQDSRIALAIDQQLVDEGLDQRTPEYWDELTSRLKKVLPHRYRKARTEEHDDEADADERPRQTNNGARKPITTGSGRDSGGPRGKGFVLSPQRVAAIKEAGKWDDQKERNRMIQYYMNFDKQQRAAGSTHG